MSYMYMMSPCAACKTPITYNPEKVPSIRVNGVREAICKSCFDKWNVLHRTSKGLKPIKAHPDAYKPIKTNM